MSESCSKPPRVNPSAREFGSSQPGLERRQPCHTISISPRSFGLPCSPCKNSLLRSARLRLRKSIMRWQNRNISRFFSARLQSNQLISLSWQYGLLLPRWVRRNSSPPQILDLLIIRRTFDAAVPAQVVIRTIPISFAVRFVVLTVVGNEVVEGKAVMAGNEVDAVDRQMAAPLIDVGAPGDARRYRAHKSGIAFHKAPNIIAVPPVPLGPAITRKVTDLVCARCIPGFSDDLGVRQHVGQLDRPDYGRIRHQLTGLISCENRSL